MKLNRIRFFLSCILICALLLLTACSTDSSATPDNTNVPDESKLSDANTSIDTNTDINTNTKEPGWVYVPHTIALEEEGIDYDDIQLAGDMLCYISRGGNAENSARSIFQYSITDQKLTTVSIGWENEAGTREIGSYIFTQDCNLYLISNIYSADYSQLSRFLCKFDSEGKSLFSQDITEQLDKDMSVSGIAVDEQGRVYILTYDGILLYDENGTYYGSISYNSSEDVIIKDTVIGNDGGLYILICKNNNPDNCTLAKVDYETRQIVKAESTFTGIKGLSAAAIQDENPTFQCDFLIYDEWSVYAYNSATQESKELFFWLDSDINGSSVANFGMLNDGRFYVSYEDLENDDAGLALLTRTNAEQAVQKENLVLAAVNAENSLTAMAVYFNKNNSQYHITLKNYDSMNDLYNAILAGESIDVISLSGINIQKMSSQNIFEDLTPYVEQSSAFGHDDFIDGILDTYIFNETLTGIPATFILRTIVGNNELTGGKTGMTLDELFAATDLHPEAMAYDGITKEELLQNLMMFNEETFIDWNTGECRFDSAEFKKMLEFVKQFPDTIDDFHEGEESLPTRIQNGKVLFAIAEINALRYIQVYNEIFKNNASYIGFPSADGTNGNLLITNDAFAIASGSEHKDSAWMFIEQELIRGNENCYANSSSSLETYFPTLKKTFDAMVNDKMTNDSQRPANRFGMAVYEDGWSFTYHALTQEEVNIIFNMLLEARPASFAGNDKNHKNYS